MNTTSTTKPTLSPVRLHHVPNWFRLRLLKKFGHGGTLNGWDVLHHAVAVEERLIRGMGEEPCHRGMWLDHFGSTVIDGQTYFVSEPYAAFPPDFRSMNVPHWLAHSINWRLLILPESAWNPPSTIRLLFKPND